MYATIYFCVCKYPNSYGRIFMGGIKMKTTDKKNNKKQPELLKVLDQPMISQLNGGRDSKKDHKDFLLKKAKEKKEE